ncbi:MAG: T9SS type B sorting domain-containing protein, partial [Lutibacter sp.]|nr:T9SS type B sorting domain-containing protein [Lutibacter sp.]
MKLEVLDNNYVSTNENISLNNIIITDDSNNNTITINNSSGISDYEYALDRFDEFQETPFFENVAAGIHTVSFRDKNNCNISMLEVYVLGFPKFFTPNNDGYNDTWKIIGVNEKNYAKSNIYIFDRFGKFITQINPEEEGWD